MDLKAQLGKKLKKFRQQHQMSQEDLAYFLDVTTGAISYLETGKSFVSASLLVKICEVLKIQPRDLFDFDSVTPDSEAQEIINSINSGLSTLDNEKLRYINKIVRVFNEKD